jgi:hypothetical protein
VYNAKDLGDITIQPTDIKNILEVQIRTLLEKYIICLNDDMRKIVLKYMSTEILPMFSVICDLAITCSMDMSEGYYNYVADGAKMVDSYAKILL